MSQETDDDPEVTAEQLDGMGSAFGTQTVDVRVENGEGYITLKPPRGDPHEFEVAVEEIVNFITGRQSELPPAPSRPEEPKPKIEPPEQWSGGEVVHTGGGIWCREFSRSYQDLSIRVIYNVKHCDGLSVQAYSDTEDRTYLGEITVKSLGDLAPTDPNAAHIAAETMKEINNGGLDEEIQIMKRNSPHYPRED